MSACHPEPTLGAGTSVRFYPLPQEEQQAQCREHHLAKMMPSAVLASSRRVGSHAQGGINMRIIAALALVSLNSVLRICGTGQFDNGATEFRKGVKRLG
jgi:hypothetical protein